jgi:very-short-patch-repair endonuclease
MGKERATSPDSALARIAANQHGVVSLEQLHRYGISSRAVSGRLRSGRLRRIHRGVYAFGHARLTDRGRWMAAVLACGEGAVLSHRSAAALWRLLPSSHPATDVTVPGRSGRKRRKDIRLHRSASLVRRMTTLRDGIPVTTPARTLLDLRRCVTPHELGRARRQAEVFGYPLGDAAEIEPDLTRSELERRFLALCRRHRLPSPEVNARVGDHVVDFLWRRSGVIVETDGYRYHRGRATFEHDHARQTRLIAAGYEVIRFTWRQIVDDPDEVIAAVRACLTPTLTQPRFALPAGPGKPGG